MVAALYLGRLHAALLLALMFACFVGIGLCFPNALAGALAPYPDRAGAASSLLGFTQMAMASAVGALVGAAYQAFPGAAPMVLAMLGCACVALGGAHFAGRGTTAQGGLRVSE